MKASLFKSNNIKWLVLQLVFKLLAEKWGGIKEPLNEGERGERKNGLKLNIKKTKIMATGPITSWQIAVYVELFLKMVQNLQLVQNAAAWSRWQESYWFPCYYNMDWLLVHFQNEFKVLFLTYVACVRAIWKDHISPYNPLRSLRSSGQGLLHVLSPFRDNSNEVIFGGCC